MAKRSQGWVKCEDRLPYYRDSSCSLPLPRLHDHNSTTREPYLRKTGLEWADVVPVLETIDSVAELKDAVAEPEAFLERLAEASGPAAKKLVIMHLKPKLEPYLRKTGLEWADVVPVLETIDSVAELKDAVAEPEAFLERLAQASGPASQEQRNLRREIGNLRAEVERLKTAKQPARITAAVGGPAAVPGEQTYYKPSGGCVLLLTFCFFAVSVRHHRCC
jgi:hypothetical protein